MKADEKLIKEMEAFDDAFPDGVFAIPRNPNDPRVKVSGQSLSPRTAYRRIF